MSKEKYKQMMDQICPEEELLGELLRSAKASAHKKNANRIMRRPVMAVLTVLLCLSMAVPVLGANVESVYQLMYKVSPEMAQLFQPVRRSMEADGIKLEVVSSYIHDNMAEIYVTMHDRTGDRIDDTTDLYDSYSINRPFDSTATCERVGFDKKTKTATFLISITEWGNHKVEGKKITFSVKEFLSHKKTYNDMNLPLDLTEIAKKVETQEVYLTGGGGKGFTESEKNGKAETLKPRQPIAAFPIEGIELTGAGYVKEKLHVQIALKNRLQSDTHGSLYLKDRNGKRIDCDYNMYFTNQYEDEKQRIDYCEYVFDVPEKEIAGYLLYGDFVTSGMHTEGYWRVTFPLMKEKGAPVHAEKGNGGV